jgi:hypothetical protein
MLVVFTFAQLFVNVLVWYGGNARCTKVGMGWRARDMQSLPLKLFISVSILSISNYGSLLLHLIASHLCIRTQLGFLNMYVQMHVLYWDCPTLFTKEHLSTSSIPFIKLPLRQTHKQTLKKPDHLLPFAHLWLVLHTFVLTSGPSPNIHTP